jgi:N-acylneuraminate cytidylyltransferase
MNYVALIFARGGSKGLPGKNVRSLGGRPLLSWAVRAAKKVERISRVIVSTDSEEIAQVALASGAEVPFMRPAELAQDDSPEWLAWRHAINYLKDENKEDLDGLVSLPTTSPLRAVEDINNCLDVFEKNTSDVVITVTDAHRSPYFNMVTLDEQLKTSLVIPQKGVISRRQDVPEVYDVTTVAYVARPQFVLSEDSIFSGDVKSVYVPRERALDIDTLYDFKLAECLIKERDDLIR